MRSLATGLLAVVVAVSLFAAGPAAAEPLWRGEASPSIWESFLNLLRPIFAASEGDTGPHWDPNGLTAPPPDSSNAGTGPHWDPDGLGSARPSGAGEHGSRNRNTDTGPEWDPNG